MRLLIGYIDTFRKVFGYVTSEVLKMVSVKQKQRYKLSSKEGCPEPKNLKS